MATQLGTNAVHEYVTQRRWQRFKLDLPLRVIVKRDEKTTIVSGRGTEVSQGGLAIFAGTELKSGDEIFVEFTPPYSGEPLRVRGLICNRSGYRYGVEFQFETSKEQEEVAKFRVLLQFAAGTIQPNGQEPH